MALFIRDDAVDSLVEEAKAALNVSTKKEAVRLALQKVVDEAPKRKRRRRFDFSKAQALADKIGPIDPDFDMKKFMDDGWGDI